MSHETAQIWCICFGLPKLTCVKFWRIETSSDYSAFKVSMFMKRTLLEWNVLTIFSYFFSELNLYWNSMNWKLNGIVTMGIEKMWALAFESIWISERCDYGDSNACKSKTISPRFESIFSLQNWNRTSIPILEGKIEFFLTRWIKSEGKVFQLSTIVFGFLKIRSNSIWW